MLTQSHEMGLRKLTPREAEVALEVARGLSNSEVGRALGISIGSAKRHLKHIMLKWDCTNRTQVAVWVALAMEKQGGL